MILREAKLDDFEVFKELYEDKKELYQFLYIYSKRNTCINTNESYSFDSERLCQNYTFEQFKEELKTSFIYMIEHNSEIIGYISLFDCGYGKYKISEWAMFDSNDTSKKIQVLNCLKKLKLPRLKMFILSPISDEVSQFLTENGFYPSETAFYKHDIV